MPIRVKKREGESVNTLIYRFNKRVQQSGLVREVRKRQFRKRAVNRRKRKDSALYRMGKQEAIARDRKFGLITRDR
jgi:ribosomal protein S21